MQASIVLLVQLSYATRIYYGEILLYNVKKFPELLIWSSLQSNVACSRSRGEFNSLSELSSLNSIELPRLYWHLQPSVFKFKMISYTFTNSHFVMKLLELVSYLAISRFELDILISLPSADYRIVSHTQLDRGSL